MQLTVLYLIAVPPGGDFALERGNVLSIREAHLSVAEYLALMWPYPL